MKKFILFVCVLLIGGCAGLEEQNKQPPIKRYISQPTGLIAKNTLIELETRRYKNGSATQKFIFIKSENPVASVILFEGGRGLLELTETDGKPHPTLNKFGFLARNRELIAKHNLNVALIDSPSDLPQGLLQINRVNDRHVMDIKAVIKYLKNESNVPVWLMAMSNSPLSAVTVATNSKEEIAGIIFASIRTYFPFKWKIHKKFPNGLVDLADKIEVPTLFVHHKYDKCKNHSPFKVKEVKEAMINCPKVDLLYFQGGKFPQEPDCWPRSPHGFFGIEDQVIENVAGFIKENS